MKFEAVNEAQIVKHLVGIMKANPKKLEQFRKVYGISHHYNNDGNIGFTCEMYNGNIVRYLIKGAMSSMTITVNALTNEIVRKKRNEQPWAVGSCGLSGWEILKEFK